MPSSSVQGGSPGSPELTQQWQFQPANNTDPLAPFGSVFWPGTFGPASVTQTSWDFGYNSPNLSGYVSDAPAGYFSILPDSGDTRGVEIEAVFVDAAGNSCFPFQFVGQTDGTQTGEWLMSLPGGDGAFTFGVAQSDGSVLPYLSMSGLQAASASAPGSAAFGTSDNPLTLSVTGALLIGHRLTMNGSGDVSGSLQILVGGATAPEGVNAQLYLEPAEGSQAILGFGQAGDDQWRLYINGEDGYLRVQDFANSRAALTFQPGTTSTSKITVNGPVQMFYGLGVWDALPPSAQPTAAQVTDGYTAGTSAPVTVDGTFAGSVGSAAYTIADIVNALKLTGIIAS